MKKVKTSSRVWFVFWLVTLVWSGKIAFSFPKFDFSLEGLFWSATFVIAAYMTAIMYHVITVNDRE